MFSEETLIKIFTDEELRNVPFVYLFLVTSVIERVLKEEKE